MKNKGKKFNLTDVLTVSLAHLLHDIYSSFLAPILPLLIDKLGISVFQAGLLDIIRKIPSLFNPFIGLIADKVSVRYVLIIAPAITSTAMTPNLHGLSISHARTLHPPICRMLPWTRF